MFLSGFALSDLCYLPERTGKRVPAFTERGVSTVAVSSDSEARAGQMAEKIGASALRIGYDLDLKVAREWGLYISTSRGKTSIGIEEPALFSEPGLFMVSPDQALYYGSIQTMPFVRPHFAELIGALDFAIGKRLSRARRVRRRRVAPEFDSNSVWVID